ncbi:hypothetical protein WH52_01120 [Tenacibaculum holothuriorum]|uniref:UspA domain-containing protein n=1 Tax=Tenacibaculum holothuriorum TaxID=1635173 RepID=A0A1Y2PFK0_9FLAO|nr:universal stress protein [Tenacibaculum holothuriorum]OSY89276.1 hypothetical protein WH52_01120 [Tenacibaculum holothuriorum]
MKRILIPTDFSDNAWAATIYALNFFANVKCTFYLLHSAQIKSSRMSSFSSKLSEVMKENALNDLRHLQERLEKVNANDNHTFEVRLSFHDIEQAVNISVEKNNIDFVVMSTKGATGAKEIFIGSNTTDVINNFKACPMLVIPANATYQNPERLAFPSDLKRMYSNTSIDVIKEFASLNKSKVEVVHFWENAELTQQQQENLDSLRMYLDDVESDFSNLQKRTNKTESINNFINDKQINTLIMLKYQHSFFENLFREAVIQNLGHHIKIPFLIIPA